MFGSSRDGKLSFYPVVYCSLEYCLESVKKYSKGKIHDSKPEPRNGNVKILSTSIHQGKYSNQSHGVCLQSINKHGIANVSLYLCFQVRIMYVKNINLYKLPFTIKHYQLR